MLGALGGKTVTHNETDGGFWSCTLVLTKQVNASRIMRVRFLSGHRDSHKYAKGEAKINFVVWVWNWVFQHELVFKQM